MAEIDERTAIRRAAQAREAARLAQSAQTSATNAAGQVLRLRQENQYLQDRCARLEAFCAELAGRVSALEALTGRGE